MTSAMSEPTNTKLYSKLAQVTAEVGYVAKDGTNDFQNYKYTSAEALLAAIRGPLSERGIALMPSVTAISEREYTTSKGKASVITTVHVSFTLVDGEDGGTHQCEWAGEGDDPADKGLGKAYTNAIKTFLRQQFLIPQGDDPEADRSTDERANDRAPRGRSNGPQQRPEPVAQQPNGTERVATAKQRGLIFAKAGESKMPASMLANLVLVSAGSEPREFDSEDAAQAWLKRALDRLPAKSVDVILKNIEAEVAAA